MSDAPEPLRPRDFALLLLGSHDLAPRRRARDQQADRVGLELKRRVLAELVAYDPEPDEIEAVLMQIVEDLGPPTGPTRSLAVLVLDEWRAAAASPEWLVHQLGEAVRPPAPEEGRRGRGLPG
jgi:hypothetical protein